MSEASTEAETGAAPRQRRGRPRDAAVDERLRTVALTIYAERGWAGFNFDVVAGQARVSKDAVYRRYSDKLELLLAAMSEGQSAATIPDAGAELRPFLFGMARDYFTHTLSDRGVAALRVYVESLRNPELVKAHRREAEASRALAARKAIRRAMDEGRLPLVSSPTAVLDAVLGGVVMHVLATPPELQEKMIAESDAYLAELVDLVLRGSGYDARRRRRSGRALG